MFVLKRIMCNCCYKGTSIRSVYSLCCRLWGPCHSRVALFQGTLPMLTGIWPNIVQEKGGGVTACSLLFLFCPSWLHACIWSGWNFGENPMLFYILVFYVSLKKEGKML